MRNVFLLLVLASVPSAALPAQNRAKVDIGIHAGATIIFSGGETEYVLGLPGGGTVIGLFPPVYATFFAGSNLMIEPQVSFTYQSFLDAGLLGTALQVGYLVTPEAHGSLYVAAHLQAATAFGDGSNTEFAAGGSVGYRHAVRDFLALRYEGRFRRWFDADLNEVALLVGFGVTLR